MSDDDKYLWGEGDVSIVRHRDRAASDTALYAELTRFCQSGPNKGKPGVCPEHQGRKQGVLARTGKVGRAVRVAKVAEHHVLEKIKAKVPPKLQQGAALAAKAVFSTWIPAQAAAVAVAREVGGERHAKKVGRLLLAGDLIAAKIVPAGVGAVAGPAAASVAYMTPLASTAYLAYSTARHPVATFRAAKKAIGAAGGLAKSAAKKVGLAKSAEKPQWPKADIAALLHGFDAAGDSSDWYEALATAALQATGGDLAAAVKLADKALAAQPDDPDVDDAALYAELTRFCQEGENKGKPGVCPGDGSSGGEEKRKQYQPRDVAKYLGYEPLKKSVELDSAIARDGTKIYRWSMDDADTMGAWTDSRETAERDGLAAAATKKKPTKGFGKKWREGLRPAEKEAFEQYSLESTRINSSLRAGVADAGKLKPMDDAIARSTLPAETTLYRGLTSDLDLEPGDEFSDRGYASTSTSRNVAEDFMLGHDDTKEGGAMMEIKAPKGSHAADMNGLSGHDNEAEIVLPRNTSFRIANVRIENRVKIYEVNLVKK